MPKIEITGNIDKVSSYILWAKRQWYLREGRWFKHVGECLIEFFRVGEVGYIKLLADSSRGFVTHPRSGVPRGFQFPGHDSALTSSYGPAHTGKGYRLDSTGLVDEGDVNGAQEGQPYPLIDEDVTPKHWLFEQVNGEWAADGPQELFYGNVDWKGPAGDDPASREILTYKGNPSRYWPVNQFVEIPGLSSVDHFVEGVLNNYEYMTVFGDRVYSGGGIIATMPQLYHPLNTTMNGPEASHQNAQVLGAAYRSTDNLLLCIIKTCYNTYPRLKGDASSDDFKVSAWHVYRDGVVVQDWLDEEAGARAFVAANSGYTVVEVPDPGRGYFIEVVAAKQGNIPGGWTRLAQISTETAWANCNFFFSEDGTKAVSVQLGEVWTIEITGDVVTYTRTDAGKFWHHINTTSDRDQSLAVPWGEGAATPQPKDWKNYDKLTRSYRQTKSGSVVIAADYKGNELVTMRADLSGENYYTHVKENNSYWGNTAQIPSLEEPADRLPYFYGGFCQGDGSPHSVAFAYQVNGCKPKLTINSIPAEQNECITLHFPECTGTTPAYLDITLVGWDEVTGLTITETSRVRDGAGHWELVAYEDNAGDTNCPLAYSGFWYGGSTPVTTRDNPNYCDYNVNDPSTVPFSCRVDPDWTIINSSSCTEYKATRYNWYSGYPTSYGCSGTPNDCTTPIVGSFDVGGGCYINWYQITQIWTYRWIC